MPMPERVTGKIKWFNSSKGYGFITPDKGGSDVFVHYSALSGDGYKTIQEGSAVEFTTVIGKKGMQAEDVVEV